MIVVQCNRGWSGKHRTDDLLAKYGDTDIQQFQHGITADFPQQPDWLRSAIAPWLARLNLVLTSPTWDCLAGRGVQ